MKSHKSAASGHCTAMELHAHTDSALCSKMALSIAHHMSWHVTSATSAEDVALQLQYCVASEYTNPLALGRYTSRLF